jgi:hypothetical protein
MITKNDRKTMKQAAKQKGQLIKAFIELPPAGRATLYASIVSMNEAQRGNMDEARRWWAVVGILHPDIAENNNQHLK